MGVKPENAVMVGDTLPADILGAQQIGMKSIWIARRADRSENNEVLGKIKPDYTIHDLASLVDLVPQIYSSPS
jgi:FMN phosphatase YigB (HAD superfamily)